MHYYKFNIADWSLHTAHLSLIEEAIYFRLVNYYYDTEKPIPHETQLVTRRLRLETEVETVSVILSEFFTLKDNQWFHSRCEKEIKDFKKKAKVNKANGAKGGRPRNGKGLESNPEITQTVSENNPDITLTTNQEPLTNNHKPVIKDLLCEEAFSIFYSSGLIKRSKAKALSLFKSLVKQMECDPIEFAELLKSDVQYRINNNQFGINKLHPSTYLNQQRWTDEHEESNNGHDQGGRKLSAAERIRERNEAKYGNQQQGGGLGMAADGGDIRGTVGEGTRGGTIIDMESGSQQADPSRS